MDAHRSRSTPTRIRGQQPYSMRAADAGSGCQLGGFLSGKYSGDSASDGRRANFDFPPVDLERGDRIVAALREIGQAHDASPARVALAWLLHQEGVTSVIIGARKQEQLTDNLAAIELSLSADELAQLSDVSALAPEYPHYMPAAPRGVDPLGSFDIS